MRGAALKDRGPGTGNENIYRELKIYWMSRVKTGS